jgi:hypothetical protein
MFSNTDLIPVNRRRIIEFGFVFFVVLSIIIPLISLWRNDWEWQPWLDWSVAIGLSLFILCLSTGTLMAPFYRAWMKLAIIMGTIMTAIIVSIVFVFLITPIGLLKRILKSKSDYEKEIQTERLSYWNEVQFDNDPKRLEKMY